jgi:hypothetical protein
MSFDNVFDCAKCQGKGRIQAFRHYAQGDCFQCKGTGKITLNNLPSSATVSLVYKKGWIQTYPENSKPVKRFQDELYQLVSYADGSVDSKLIADFNTTEDKTEYRNLWANFKGQKMIEVR